MLTEQQLAIIHSAIQTNPSQLIFNLIIDNKKIWIKQRPSSKKKAWHTVQWFLSKLLASPIINPTVSMGGPHSLHEEAFRLQSWANIGVAVPAVLLVTEDCLVTSDVGITLHDHLQTLSVLERKVWLLKTVKALNDLHRKSLVHGRPSSRDIMILDAQLYFIDLEEDPLLFMSLAQAQARDVWLLFNNFTRYEASESELLQLFEHYLCEIPKETLIALRKLILLLKPLRYVVEKIPKINSGRDVQCAIKANRVFEQAFKEHPSLMTK